MKNKTLYIIVAAVASLFAISGLVYKVINMTRNHTLNVYRERLELNYYGVKDTLVSAVDAYIQNIAPESCLNGLTVVNECEKHEIDLVFVLAQGKVESHFATKGIASKTHSVFNVYSYDGKSAEEIIRRGRGYSHPDESIVPYIRLLKKNYLNDGKTEMDLLDKFINKDGNRYATDKNYESKLLSTYKEIQDSTDINVLWEKLLKYKMLSRK